VGGKHGKYVYIKVKNNEYLKARVFKNRADDDPEKYLITGPKRSTAPLTYSIVDINDLPEELREKILGKTSEPTESEVEPETSE
jgi:hypothetical protein